MRRPGMRMGWIYSFSLKEYIDFKGQNTTQTVASNCIRVAMASREFDLQHTLHTYTDIISLFERKQISIFPKISNYIFKADSFPAIVQIFFTGTLSTFRQTEKPLKPPICIPLLNSYFYSKPLSFTLLSPLSPGSLLWQPFSIYARKLLIYFNCSCKLE